MRSSWEALQESLERSVRPEQSSEPFLQLASRHPELATFPTPGSAVAFLRSESVAAEAKAPVFEALVTAWQAGVPLAQPLLFLGLGAALRLQCWRHARRFELSPDEALSEVVDAFLATVGAVDLDRVSCIGATLVRNTERRLLDRHARHQRHEARSRSLDDIGEEELGVVAPREASALSMRRGASEGEEAVLLWEWLQGVVEQREARLIFRLLILEEERETVARQLRITRPLLRLRLHKALNRVRAHFLEEIDGAEETLGQIEPPSSFEPAVQEEPAMTNLWQQTEEMAKKHDQSSSTWLRLANDGDRAVVVVLGDPFPREVVFIDNKYVVLTEKLKAEGNKGSLRVAFNVAMFDTKEVKVLEQGVVFFKDLNQVREKYGLTKWAFEIRRNGAAKDPKTTYSILPEHQLTPAQQEEFSKLALHDLQALYEGGGAEAAAKPAAGTPIDEKTAQAITVVLKSLPKEAVERFCKKLGVSRIREIPAVQQQLAIDLLEAVEAEFKPKKAADLDPFA